MKKKYNYWLAKYYTITNLPWIYRKCPLYSEHDFVVYVLKKQLNIQKLQLNLIKMRNAIDELTKSLQNINKICNEINTNKDVILNDK